MANILVVEDDVLLNKGLSFSLEKDNHIAFKAFTYLEAMNLFSEKIELVLLDINLPDGSGMDICKNIRGASEVPIIFLTANDTEEDMINGFKIGCDDYIAKPFSVEVLRKKVLAILKRSIVKENNIFTYKGLMVDYDKRLVKCENKEVKLTVTEYNLLKLLIKNKGQVVTRGSILEKLWDKNGNFVDENALSVNIRRLRQKIEGDPRIPLYIITVFGVGYTFGE